MLTEHVQAIFQMANSKIKQCSTPPPGKEIKIKVEKSCFTCEVARHECKETVQPCSPLSGWTVRQLGVSGGHFGQNASQSSAQARSLLGIYPEENSAGFQGHVSKDVHHGTI